MFDFLPMDTIPYQPPTVYEHKIHENNSDKTIPYWEIPLEDIAKQHLDSMSIQELEDDWRLNEFFGTIAVINLPKDADRLERMTQELQQIGTYDFDIFPAIDGRTELDASIWSKMYKNRGKYDTDTEEGHLALERLHQGEAGCYMSHYSLIKRTQKAFEKALKSLQEAIESQEPNAIAEAETLVRKHSRILVLEDDNGFGIVDPSKSEKLKSNAGYIFRKALTQLPRRWDMIYLMCAPREKTKKIAKNLRKIGSSVYMNAYVVNYTMYEPITKELEKITLPHVHKILPVDRAVSAIHKHYQVFAITPSIAFQYEGLSSIDNAEYRPKLTQF